tara:strand:- start:44 stop:349 length:306 start_codon:yes stop_codon:yes gene_type:complete
MDRTDKLQALIYQAKENIGDYAYLEITSHKRLNALFKELTDSTHRRADKTQRVVHYMNGSRISIINPEHAEILRGCLFTDLAIHHKVPPETKLLAMTTIRG